MCSRRGINRGIISGEATRGEVMVYSVVENNISF